jgi:hypothetical protein
MFSIFTGAYPANASQSTLDKNLILLLHKMCQGINSAKYLIYGFIYTPKEQLALM